MIVQITIIKGSTTSFPISYGTFIHGFKQQQIIKGTINSVVFQVSPICVQWCNPIEFFLWVRGRVISTPGTMCVGKSSPVQLYNIGLANIQQSTVKAATCN